MFDLIAGVLSGGVTGLLGTVISGGMKFFENKQKHAFELAIMDKEMVQMDKEAEIARDIKEMDMEGKESQAAWKALESSYKESTTRMSTGDSGWLIAVDVVRGMMRPFITVSMLMLMAIVYFTLATPPEQAKIIVTILYIATTCVLWWFGTRNMSKK